jgi:hypothetical protein
MTAVCSSKTLVPTYKSTRRYNPEDQHRRVKSLFVFAVAGRHLRPVLIVGNFNET